jgi:hypothetical protein
MKIEFKSEVYSLGEISLKELKRYKMINDYVYNQVRVGGCGELIERIILDYLTTKSGYTNIKKSPANSKWDFELTDDPTVRVDVRRVSPTNTIYLGHTSGNLKKLIWEDKAEVLNNGGYFCIKLCDDKMVLFYISAKSLLNYVYEHPNFELKNEVPVKILNEKFWKTLNVPLDN